MPFILDVGLYMHVICSSVASAVTCFETRLGCIDAENNSWQQQMIDSNAQIFQLSLKIRFSIPWYKLVATPTWRKLIQMEDFFFGCVYNDRSNTPRMRFAAGRGGISCSQILDCTIISNPSPIHRPLVCPCFPPTGLTIIKLHP